MMTVAKPHTVSELPETTVRLLVTIPVLKIRVCVSVKTNKQNVCQ